MSIYVLGDIHGAAKALDQVLDRAPYEPGEDTLVILGDVADGWPETKRAVQTLVDLPHPRVHLMGNHDKWAKDWMEKGMRPRMWVKQGGQATIDSYKRTAGAFGKGIPESHRKYFGTATRYWQEERTGAFFVHGGFPPHSPTHPSKLPMDTLIWDRDLIKQAIRYDQEGLDLELPDNISQVYVGHTPVNRYVGSYTPAHFANSVWALDTGAGYEGRLTMMRVEDNEYWQSDLVPELYPDVERAR